MKYSATGSRVDKVEQTGWTTLRGEIEKQSRQIVALAWGDAV